VLQSFEEQLLDARHILWSRAAKSVGYLVKQGRRKSDPRIDRARIDLEGLLEEPLPLL